MKRHTPAAKAAQRRGNARAAAKRLQAKITCGFPADARLYTLSLDLHSFHLTRELLLWHWQAAFIRPLRAQCAMRTAPVPLRYIYALDMRQPDTPRFLFLTDAPDNEVQAACAGFWLHSSSTATLLEAEGAQRVAELMTMQIHGDEGLRVKAMYTASVGLCRAAV